jgi:hypothetical protein
MGAYHGRKSFDIFSHQKSVLFKKTFGDVSARYPPYTANRQKLMNVLAAYIPGWPARFVCLAWKLLQLAGVGHLLYTVVLPLVYNYSI